MEIPFYLSFKEFETNYSNDLGVWLSLYPDATEVNYLKELVGQYKHYLRYNNIEQLFETDATIEIRDCIFPYFRNSEVRYIGNFGGPPTFRDKEGNIFRRLTLNMMEYAQYILDKTYEHLERISYTLAKNETILEHISDSTIISSHENFGYWLNEDLHQLALPFLKAYITVSEKKVNPALYRNFEFSIPKIADLIDKRLTELDLEEFTIKTFLLNRNISGVLFEKEIPEKQCKADVKNSHVAKIKVNGSLQALGFIFTELIEKGYIEPIRKTGKINVQGTAQFLLDHFEFTKDMEQPSLEGLRQSLFSQNKFSMDKQNLFKIPGLNQIEK
jgi:hypothetical protein